MLTRELFIYLAPPILSWTASTGSWVINNKTISKSSKLRSTSTYSYVRAYMYEWCSKKESSFYTEWRISFTRVTIFCHFTVWKINFFKTISRCDFYFDTSRTFEEKYTHVVKYFSDNPSFLCQISGLHFPFFFIILHFILRTFPPQNDRLPFSANIV